MAPALRQLLLSYNNLTGPLPQEWGSFSALEELVLDHNALTGELPASWKGMRGLVAPLYVSFNRLTGRLPPEWGCGGMSPNADIYIDGNPGITGSVPKEWACFRGFVAVGPNITGCVPDQLQYSMYVYNDQGFAGDNTPCSVIDPEVQALVDLKALLAKAVRGTAAAKAVLPSWDVESRSETPSPGLVPPAYCRNWQGVKCNQLNEVIDGHMQLASSIDTAAVISVFSAHTYQCCL